MKKILSTLILLTALSTFAFADDGGGHLPGDGKPCTPGQTGCSRLDSPVKPETENQFIKTVEEFLFALFG